VQTAPVAVRARFRMRQVARWAHWEVDSRGGRGRAPEKHRERSWLELSTLKRTAGRRRNMQYLLDETSGDFSARSSPPRLLLLRPLFSREASKTAGLQNRPTLSAVPRCCLADSPDLPEIRRSRRAGDRDGFFRTNSADLPRCDTVHSAQKAGRPVRVNAEMIREILR